MMMSIIFCFIAPIITFFLGYLTGWKVMSSFCPMSEADRKKYSAIRIDETGAIGTDLVGEHYDEYRLIVPAKAVFTVDEI